MESMFRVDAGRRRAAPRWALLQRDLLRQLESAAREFVERYCRDDGTLIWRSDWPGMDGSDDPYEAFQNLPLLYALGGSDELRRLGDRAWESITWQWTEYGQIRDEFDRYYDWMHHGESSHLVYFSGLSDPASVKWKRRAIKFASLYLGDSDASNFDPARGLMRSPLTGADGPRFVTTPEDWSTHRRVIQQSPYDDLPGVDTEAAFPWLVAGDFERILDAVNSRMMSGDIPLNLHATAMMAHAFMFSGDGRFVDWVMRYVAEWTDRTSANGGIVPDNIGPSGIVGELNDGKWWGGYYGWSWPRGLKDILEAATNGARNALLLGGGERFLELPRMQADASWALRRSDSDGGWLVPALHSDRGWHGHGPAPHVPLVQLWEASRAEEDADRVERLDLPDRVRRPVSPRTSGWDPELGRDTKHLNANTLAWFEFARGRNPSYPEQILDANLETIARQLDRMRSPSGDPAGWDTDHPYSIHMWQEMSPLVVESLVQLTMGSSIHMSHGGLQSATLRYFDTTEQRPGLPPDVAALVTPRGGTRVELELVNTGLERERSVIVQAGGFGEHAVRALRRLDEPGAPRSEVAMTRFEVVLAPGASVHLELDIARFVRPPTYATPWVDPVRTQSIVPRPQDPAVFPEWARRGAYGPPTIVPGE
ncbi:hypothetical protein [Agromyces sp. SYSU T00194]|uniref:hypothetical protein n=1 Tax=Agromyces chitinivorans TaxID=3158560 RepID=UPI00339A3116